VERLESLLGELWGGQGYGKEGGKQFPVYNPGGEAAAKNFFVDHPEIWLKTEVQQYTKEV